jgi:hypothetical protein
LKTQEDKQGNHRAHHVDYCTRLTGFSPQRMCFSERTMRVRWQIENRRQGAIL